MSDKKRRSRILTNVVDKIVKLNNSKELLEENVNTASLNYSQRSSGKENRSSVPNTMIVPENKSKGRFTASMLVFGEEPVFSDSDEETEYHRKIFETQDSKITSSGVPKTVNVGIQCEIISNETTLKNLVKECAKFNTEDVNEEFKLVVLHCKNLQNMYGNNIPPLSVRRSVWIDDDNVTEIQMYSDEPNMMSSIEYPNSPSTSMEFLPTNRRSNNSFSSESLDAVDTGKPSIEGDTDTLSQDGSSSNKGDVTKRSTRSTNSGKSKGKPTYKTINTRKYETRLKKSNSNFKTLKNDPTSVSATSNSVGQKRPSSESTTTRISKRAKKEIPEIDENTPAMASVMKSRKTKRKPPPLTLEYFTERFKDYNISILLPKRKARSMGKNWINAKHILKPHDIPVSLTNCNSRRSSQETHRARRLYSPTEWLLSKEFSTLVQPEIKHNSQVPNIH